MFIGREQRGRFRQATLMTLPQFKNWLEHGDKKHPVDKDKFIKAFNGGRGALYLSDVQFDESSQAYLVQVSVPVMDGKSCIGVVIFGVDLDKFK